MEGSNLVLYRATVTKVTDNGVYVQVPDLGVGMEFGPCETCTYVDTKDRVLVGQVAGMKEDLIVLSRIYNKRQYDPVLTVNGQKGPFAVIPIG